MCWGRIGSDWLRNRLRSRLRSGLRSRPRSRARSGSGGLTGLLADLLALLNLNELTVLVRARSGTRSRSRSDRSAGLLSLFELLLFKFVQSDGRRRRSPRRNLRTRSRSRRRSRRTRGRSGRTRDRCGSRLADRFRSRSVAIRSAWRSGLSLHLREEAALLLVQRLEEIFGRLVRRIRSTRSRGCRSRSWSWSRTTSISGDGFPDESLASGAAEAGLRGFQRLRSNRRIEVGRNAIRAQRSHVPVSGSVSIGLGNFPFVTLVFTSGDVSNSGIFRDRSGPGGDLDRSRGLLTKRFQFYSFDCQIFEI